MENISKKGESETSKKKLISFAMTLVMLLSCMITVSAALTWTGRFSDLSGYTNGYVGENYAMTTFTKTNGTESVAGVDKISECLANAMLAE